MKRIIVTGAAGFIGSNFVRRALEQKVDWDIVAFDALTYAGNLDNLSGLEQTGRFEFVHGDICDESTVRSLFDQPVWAMINFAAESHVDRSIHGGAEFVRTNVMGTQVLLDQCRQADLHKFLQVSTDEVYGSLGPRGKFTEDSPLAPNSPYSASKASADLLVRAYHETCGVPGVVTRCSNNYGPYQFPEKMIPLFITNLLENQAVPLYGDGLNIRDWIHVWDHCDALMLVLEYGEPGDIFNIGADNELTNIELTYALLSELDKDASMIRRVKDRPAHDRRYAIDSTRISTQLGWSPRMSFDTGLRDTVQWYIENEPWWRAIKSGEYQHYYERQYGVV